MSGNKKAVHCLLNPCSFENVSDSFYHNRFSVSRKSNEVINRFSFSDAVLDEL